MRDGKWKLVTQFPNNWELYNMEEDRTEMHNLTDQYPERGEADGNGVCGLGETGWCATLADAGDSVESAPGDHAYSRIPAQGPLVTDIILISFEEHAQNGRASAPFA